MMNKQIIIYKKECYNEPHCSLNQVLEQLEAYKMEAEEGKEINAELKAENKELKEELEAVYDDCKGCSACNEALYNGNLYAKEYRKLKQTLADIKEIAERGLNCSQCSCGAKADLDLILQKINKVEDDLV